MATNSGFSPAVMSKLIVDCDTVFDDSYLEQVLKLMLSGKPESRSKLYHLHLEVVDKFRTLGIKEKPKARRTSSSEDVRKPSAPPALMKKDSFRRASVDANQKLAITEKSSGAARKPFSGSRSQTRAPKPAPQRPTTQSQAGNLSKTPEVMNRNKTKSKAKA